MLTLVRDTSQNPDFRQLVMLLDADLNQRYGDLQAAYDQYNTIETLDTVVVAYLDEQPVACGACKPYDATTVEIKRMFVRPECRGKGLASNVLRELETWAQELGYAQAILETGRKQTAAIRLYEKSGYEHIENYGQYQGVANSMCFNRSFPLRILVLCDDFWHPAQVVREGLRALEQSGITLEWCENASDWSAALLAKFSVVLLTKSNNMSAADEQPYLTDANQHVFQEYVRQGHGLLAIHSGIAGYEQLPVMRALLGGVFLSHPDQCPVTVEPRSNHPLTTGVTAFTVQDEHYVVALDDPQADVFLTTLSEHGTQPGGWTRTEGKGRVCVLTPGHNLAVWQHPSFQTLVRNALNWVNQGTVKK